MRVTTFVLLLVALAALPAARITGLLGGPPARPAAAVRAAPHPPPATVTAQPPATSPARPTPTTPTTLAPQPFVHFLPTVIWTIANLRATGVDVYNDPTSPQPNLHLTGQTEFGTTRALPVVGQRDTWLETRLPVRPNNSVGWIRAADVDLSAVGDRVIVNLAARQLQWLHGDTVALQTPVATGAFATNTPPGEYYITDVVPSSGGYGPWILALNGHSDTYTDFEGADARLAIHGTDDPGTIGQPVSHGCVRVPNDIDTRLASTLKPGTLVDIT